MGRRRIVRSQSLPNDHNHDQSHAFGLMFSIRCSKGTERLLLSHMEGMSESDSLPGSSSSNEDRADRPDQTARSVIISLVDVDDRDCTALGDAVPAATHAPGLQDAVQQTNHHAPADGARAELNLETV